MGEGEMSGKTSKDGMKRDYLRQLEGPQQLPRYQLLRRVGWLGGTSSVHRPSLLLAVQIRSFWASSSCQFSFRRESGRSRDMYEQQDTMISLRTRSKYPELLCSMFNASSPSPTATHSHFLSKREHTYSRMSELSSASRIFPFLGCWGASRRISGSLYVEVRLEI